MKVIVRNNKGKETAKSFELLSEVFENASNKGILRQAIHVHVANSRTGTAKAKGRGEVSGTGRKPWGNNKLERARTGDLRTPIFTGGGVSHGPVPMNYGKKLTSKMRKTAVSLSLTESAKSNKLFVIENITFGKDKLTKTVAEMLSALKKEGVDTRKVVMYYHDKDHKLPLATRNMPFVKALQIAHIDPFDVLAASAVVFLEEAMEIINKSKAVQSKVEAATKSTPKTTAKATGKAPVKKATKTTKTTSKAKAK